MKNLSDYIDDWHNSNSELELHEFLGFKDIDEYSLFVNQRLTKKRLREIVEILNNQYTDLYGNKKMLIRKSDHRLFVIGDTVRVGKEVFSIEFFAINNDYKIVNGDNSKSYQLHEIQHIP